jgi:hypothetical protein
MQTGDPQRWFALPMTPGMNRLPCIPILSPVDLQSPALGSEPMREFRVGRVQPMGPCEPGTCHWGVRGDLPGEAPGRSGGCDAPNSGAGLAVEDQSRIWG